MGARRKIPAKRLTNEQIIVEAGKIIGSKADSRIIGSYVDWVQFMCTGQTALRSASSKEAMHAERRVAAWLSRGTRLLKTLPLWPLGFESFRSEVYRWDDLYKQNALRKKKYEIVIHPSKLGSLPKLFATMAALRLCEGYGLPLTTTKSRGVAEPGHAATSKFCTLAAILSGDPTGDLQHWCRRALQKRGANPAPPMF